MTRVAPLLVTACLALTATACAADDAEGDEIESTDEALRGGSYTFEHPEIGKLQTSKGGCTATLVRPNVILSAAHCLEGGGDIDARGKNWRFAIIKADGVAHWYAIDRAHSILKGSDFNSSDWHTQDISVLRLTQSVPSSLARPATLATAWPIPGRQVTLWGYGCQDRETGAGGGKKQKRDYSWSLGQWLGFTHSNALCHGDSGGPLMDTPANAVLGINSAENGSRDFFGDVPKNWREIDAQINKLTR